MSNDWREKGKKGKGVRTPNVKKTRTTSLRMLLLLKSAIHTEKGGRERVALANARQVERV